MYCIFFCRTATASSISLLVSNTMPPPPKKKNSKSCACIIRPRFPASEKHTIPPLFSQRRSQLWRRRVGSRPPLRRSPDQDQEQRQLYRRLERARYKKPKNSHRFLFFKNSNFEQTSPSTCACPCLPPTTLAL